MILHVEVTQADINHGIRNDCHYCPVARAINRALPDGYRALVSGTCLSVLHRGKVCGKDRPLPLRAMRFIDAFDRLGAGRPFSFTLDLPFITEGGPLAHAHP